MAVLLAEYMKRQVVRDRNLSALLKWSAYITQGTVTSKPTDDEARLRIVGERIPMSPQPYVDRTIAFFMKDETIQQEANLRQYLSDVNSDAVEATLADQLSGVIARFMPAFARQDVPENLLQQWYRDHGFAPEPNEAPHV